MSSKDIKKDEPKRIKATCCANPNIVGRQEYLGGTFVKGHNRCKNCGWYEEMPGGKDEQVHGKA